MLQRYKVIGFRKFEFATQTQFLYTFSVNPIKADVRFTKVVPGTPSFTLLWYKYKTFDNFWTAFGLYFDLQKKLRICKISNVYFNIKLLSKKCENKKLCFTLLLRNYTPYKHLIVIKSILNFFSITMHSWLKYVT